MELSDEQEKSIAERKEKDRGCTCEPEMTVWRWRGVFAVQVEIKHQAGCAISEPRAAPSKE